MPLQDEHDEVNWQYSSVIPGAADPGMQGMGAGQGYLDSVPQRQLQGPVSGPAIMVKNLQPSVLAVGHHASPQNAVPSRQVYQVPGNLASIAAIAGSKMPQVNRNMSNMLMIQNAGNDRRSKLELGVVQGNAVQELPNAPPSIMRDTVIMTGSNALGLEGTSLAQHAGRPLSGRGSANSNSPRNHNNPFTVVGQYNNGMAHRRTPTKGPVPASLTPMRNRRV